MHHSVGCNAQALGWIRMPWISLGLAYEAVLQNTGSEQSVPTASHGRSKAGEFAAHASLLEDVVILQVPTGSWVMTVFGSTRELGKWVLAEIFRQCPAVCDGFQRVPEHVPGHPVLLRQLLRPTGLTAPSSHLLLPQLQGALGRHQFPLPC